MSIRVRRVDDSFGIWFNNMCTFVDPAVHLSISEASIREYMREHPFPEEKTKEGYLYSAESMIEDITNSEGSLIIPGTEEQAEWVADMIGELL